MNNEIYRELSQREFRVAEVLSLSLGLFLKNLKSLMYICLIAFLPIALLDAMIAERMWPVVESLYAALGASNVGTDEVMTIMVDFGRLELILLAVLLFLAPIGCMAVGILIKSRLTMKPLTAQQALVQAFSCQGALVKTGLIIFPCIAMLTLSLLFLDWTMTIVFFAVLVYISVQWGLYVYAIALSGKSGLAALRYSTSLVKRRWWRTLSVIIGSAILILPLNLLSGSIFSAMEATLYVSVLNNLCSYFLFGLSIVSLSVMFINRELILYGDVTYLPNVEALERKEDE